MATNDDDGDIFTYGYDPMKVFYEDHATELRAYGRELVNFTVAAFAVATIVGLIGGALTGMIIVSFVPISPFARYFLDGVGVILMFAAFWCHEGRPPRWRPVILTDENLEMLGGGAASIIILGIVAAALSGWL